MKALHNQQAESVKMFSRAAATFYFVLSLALLAVALPGGSPPPPTTTITATGPPPTSTPGDLCSTGNVQCCQSIGGVRIFHLPLHMLTHC